MYFDGFTPPGGVSDKIVTLLIQKNTKILSKQNKNIQIMVRKTSASILEHFWQMRNSTRPSWPWIKTIVFDINHILSCLHFQNSILNKIRRTKFLWFQIFFHCLFRQHWFVLKLILVGWWWFANLPHITYAVFSSLPIK